MNEETLMEPIQPVDRGRRSLLTLILGVALGACVGFVLLSPALSGAFSGAGKKAGPGGHKLVVGEPATLKAPAGKEVATIAGGCFWAMQTEFQMLKGVDKVVAGYAGGTVAKPSYEQVCNGDTGHAEAIQIVFDPKIIAYKDLTRIFLTNIDPTTLNRQGPDSGTQYRSAIFYHNAGQREIAEKTIAALTAEKRFRNPIVTEVMPYKNFYSAETYHQDYCDKNPSQGYCVAVVSEEVSRFKEKNKARLK